jgi:FKBP-type peptidyl-prolyl cis-trans isomerase (trigger factor)
MLEELLKTEKVEVTDKEVDEEAEKMSQNYKMKKEDFINAFGGIKMVKYDLEIRKIIELLKEYNK